MRRAIFKISAPIAAAILAGALSATVVVEADGPHVLFRVRPYRRRREFVLPLSAVATATIFRVSRAEVDKKKRLRRRGRSSR